MTEEDRKFAGATESLFRLAVPHSLQAQVGRDEIRIFVPAATRAELDTAKACLMSSWLAYFQRLEEDVQQEGLRQGHALVEVALARLSEEAQHRGEAIAWLLKIASARIFPHVLHTCSPEPCRSAAHASKASPGLRRDPGDGTAAAYDSLSVAQAALRTASWYLMAPEVMLVASLTRTNIELGSPLFASVARALLQVFSHPSAPIPDSRSLHCETNFPIVPDVASSPDSASHLPLSEGLACWRSLAMPRPQSALEAERALARFINMFGDLAVGLISRTQMLEYRDLLARMPANLNLSAITEAKQSLRTIIAAATARGHDYRRLAPASIKKDVGSLQAVLGALQNEGWIEQNVAANIRIGGYTKTRKGQTHPRLPLRPSMMQRLFASPLFTGCAGHGDAKRTRAGSQIYQDELYWPFLFAATAGPRLEEIGQIKLDDIEELDLGRTFGSDLEGRCLVIHLTGTGEGQNLKTPESERNIIVHPRLIDIGFEAYVGARRASGAEFLFDLPRSKTGKLTRELSRRLNRYIDRVVTADRRFTFHSLRHEWKDRAEDSGIDEKLRDQIAGHSPSTVGRRYGLGASIRRQYDALSRLNLRFIDWDRLNAARIQCGGPS